MADLIDRQAVIDMLADLQGRAETKTEMKVIGKAWQAVKKMPSAQKRGKWERHWCRPGVYADLYWHCTACGGKTDMQFAYIYFKYCPYCGATMERGADE